MYLSIHQPFGLLSTLAITSNAAMYKSVHGHILLPFLDKTMSKWKD